MIRDRVNAESDLGERFKQFSQLPHPFRLFGKDAREIA